MSRANEKLKLLRAGETMLLKQRGHLEHGTALGSQRALPFLRRLQRRSFLLRKEGKHAQKERPFPFNCKIYEWILYPQNRGKAPASQLPRGETRTDRRARSPPRRSQDGGPTAGHPWYGTWGDHFCYQQSRWGCLAQCIHCLIHTLTSRHWKGKVSNAFPLPSTEVLLRKWRENVLLDTKNPTATTNNSYTSHFFLITDF